MFKHFHRYAGLLVSIQIMLWSLSGFLMAFWDFGDLYTNPSPEPLAIEQVLLTPQDVLNTLSETAPQEIVSLDLVMLAKNPFYRVKTKGKPVQIINQKGELSSPLTPSLATQIARHQYLGGGTLQTIDLLSESKGNYYSSTPVFRARFDDAQRTEVYIDPQSGALLARRKALWSWYNRMWEFHLMKFTSHSKTNKWLLLGFAVISFLVSLTGIFKFFRWG